ncbi:MAG: hypothetical protein IJC40_05240 [Muribaculaceae bacterium]|nr:hypothetical protein [Muribaculaceae bacterium]
MKKSLLIASAILMGSATAFAGKDEAVYEPVNGIELENMWLHSRVNGAWASGNQNLPFINNYAKVRTATIWTDANGVDKLVCGYSKPVNYTKDDGSQEAIDTATILIYNLTDGTLEKEIQLSYNNEPIKGLLIANQIGTDDAGNLWFSGLESDPATMPIELYSINAETGECTLEAALLLNDDEATSTGRIDYCDILGDITGKTSHAIAMFAPKASDLSILRWKREQGATEWTGDFDGYANLALTETYPAGVASWGGVTTVSIMWDEDLTGENYYVDDFSTAPALYNTSGSMLESFATATEMAPAVGCNGVTEFELAGRNFISYVLQQYNASPGCCIRIAELGEGLVFEGMTGYWDLPKDGLGEVSDGGTRMHGIMTTAKRTDAAGLTAVYLVTYKCNNGIGVYRVKETGYDDGIGGVEGIIADQDANAPAVYYNFQGVQVQNPESGAYIVKRGNTVTKEFIVK